MKSFVVMTYYQFQHAVAMALTLDEKPALYFDCGYLNIQEGFLDRIRESGVFSSVTGITRVGELNHFLADLKETEDYSPEMIDETGTSIFEKHLEPYYGELFSGADFEDTIYVYNDFQWEYYYIHKHFSDIVGIEDGYASLKQQLSIHKLKGKHQLVEKYLGKYYPEPLYRAPKIHKIISSRYFEDIPEEYKSKLEILDFQDLVNLNLDRFRKAMLFIFEMEDYEIEDGSVLFLAQPLARAGYCSPVQEYLLNRKILRSQVEQNKTVYYKAHPADRTDAAVYENEGIHILPKKVPVELLNYKECVFDEVLSFGSTGVDTLSCSRSFEKIYGKPDAGKEEINAFINQETKGEKILLNACFLVSDLTPETYVNVYSGFVTNRKYFRSESIAAVPPELEEDAKAFFDKKNLTRMISEYTAAHSVSGVCVWEDDLLKLKVAADKIKTPEIYTFSGSNDDKSLLELVQKLGNNYDYLMIVDGKSILFTVMMRIWRETEFRFQSYITFQNYTLFPNKILDFPWVNVFPGYIEKMVSGTIMNKVWHRSLIGKFSGMDEAERMRFLAGMESAARKFSDYLYVPFENYTSVSDGLEYYSERANRFLGADDEDPVNLTLAAIEVYSYMNWRHVTDKKYNAEALHEFMDSLNAEPQTKEELLERLTATLLYEKHHVFRMGFGEERDLEKYLKKKVGVSGRLIRLVTFLKKHSRGRL